MTKHGRLEALLNRKIRQEIKVSGKTVVSAPVSSLMPKPRIQDAPEFVIRPGIDTDAEKRFLGSALFNKAVCAFDRLILERCYTFEGLLEVVETWRSHGMNERQIWIQLWILYTRKKSMKFQPRLDTDPRQELLKYYDPKSVHSIMYEFERCKDTWKQRAARRRRERKERMERERLARINTDSALPNATNTTRSRPSTAA